MMKIVCQRCVFVGMRLILYCFTPTHSDDCHGLIALAFYKNKYYFYYGSSCLHCIIFVG